jgi:hypothetical protein
LITVLCGGYDGYCVSGYSKGSFPEELPSETDDHGYDSDSDIEDVDNDIVPIKPEVASNSISSTSPKQVGLYFAPFCSKTFFSHTFIVG